MPIKIKRLLGFFNWRKKGVEDESYYLVTFLFVSLVFLGSLVNAETTELDFEDVCDIDVGFYCRQAKWKLKPFTIKKRIKS